MSIELYNEEEVLQGCQQENRRCQEILYRRFAAKMYGICLSYAGDRALAQDMLQEAFVKVFRSIKDFRGDGSLEGWVRRIVVRTAIDLLRQRQSLEKLEKEEFYSESLTQNEALPNLQMGEMISYINKLPDGARVVFNLFAVEGYTHREIAEQLNISEGTSKSQYNRARTLLKDWLGKVD
jgi:RNA polymerase sigma-70 factor (ECF subfamily)